MQPRPTSLLTDYYRLLGVAEDADADALKRVYRAMARAYHPDRNPGDVKAAEHFRRVQEAYEVLSNPEQRRAYDARRRFGGLSFSGWAEAAQTGSASGNGSADAPPAEHAIVSLSFEEALVGGHAEVQTGAGRALRVTVPRGCQDGLQMRVRTGGPAGDECLYVTFQVRPHPRFRREGSHLHVVERISAVEAMLGTTRSIANAYGRKIRVPIPSGTQPGERFRLRGQGVVTARGTGDLFVEVDVEVPRELSDAQRAQLRRAAQQLGLL